MWQTYLNYHQRMGILPLKKRVNRNKCSFATKLRMFVVFAVDEILCYRWAPLAGSRTFCHPITNIPSNCCMLWLHCLPAPQGQNFDCCRLGNADCITFSPSFIPKFSSQCCCFRLFCFLVNDSQTKVRTCYQKYSLSSTLMQDCVNITAKIRFTKQNVLSHIDVNCINWR